MTSNQSLIKAGATKFRTKTGEMESSSREIGDIAPRAMDCKHIDSEISRIRAKDENRSLLERFIGGESEPEKSAKNVYKQIIEAEGQNYLEIRSKIHIGRMTELDLRIDDHVNHLKVWLEDNHIREASRLFKDRTQEINKLKLELTENLTEADTGFMDNLEKVDANLDRARKDEHLYERALQAKRDLIDSHYDFCKQLMDNFIEVITYTAGGNIGYFRKN